MNRNREPSRRRLVVGSILCLALFALPVRAADGDKKAAAIPVVVLDHKEPVSFDKEIEPILAAKCVVCHSGPVKEGRLDLGSYEGIRKGGRSGSAIVAGKSAESLLIKLAGRTDRPLMPPTKGEQKPLSPTELALLKLWIDQGARGPSGKRTRSATVLVALAPAVQTVRALAISPDKTLVAAGRGNQVHIYNAATGAYLRSLSRPDLARAAHASIVEALAFSPDGKLLASGSYQEVVLWDAQAGTVQRRLTGFADQVTTLAFSPDGKLLAVGGGAPTVDGELELIATATGKAVAEIKNGHSDTVLGLCFSPDGTKLATCAADRLVKVFEIPSGKPLKVFEGHTHHVLDVAWKADGKLLASGGSDKAVKVWDFEKGEQLRTLPDLKVSGQNRGAAFQKEVSRVRFLGDTAELVACSGDQSIRCWNVETGNFVRRLDGATDFLHALAVSPDGTVLAAGGEGGAVWLWVGGARSSRPLVPPAVPVSPRQ